jgi:hypothetical protein
MNDFTECKNPAVSRQSSTCVLVDQLVSATDRARAIFRPKAISGELPTTIRSYPFQTKPFLEAGRLILQDCQGEAVIVGGLRVTNLSLCLLELCLTQFNNGTQPQAVTCLGKIEREA